jgi:hypothetical protein
MHVRTRAPRARSAVAVGIVAALLSVGLIVASSPAGARSAGVTRRQFHDQMRKLWEDHVTWTRLFIVSLAADLPDLQATTDRLLQNQTDIGDAVKPFYGREAGTHLTDLLRTHILTAADVVTAAKNGDTDAFDQAKAAWYANANDIARFLHSLNPANWPLADLKTMMRRHLDLTLTEASDHLQGNFEQDVADYDRVHLEILRMADMLSAGIARQFPGSFS